MTGDIKLPLDCSICEKPLSYFKGNSKNKTYWCRKYQPKLRSHNMGIRPRDNLIVLDIDDLRLHLSYVVKTLSISKYVDSLNGRYSFLIKDNIPLPSIDFLFSKEETLNKINMYKVFIL